MKKIIILICIFSLTLSGCKENYSNGERIGFITKLTKKGVIWDSWEAEMNVSQTGMTSNATEFDFSIDNDQSATEPLRLILDSAVTENWKVRVKYHEVWGLKNFLGNRGHTDYFVDDVIIEDRHPLKSIFGGDSNKKDTVYFINITPKDSLKK